MGMTVVVFFPVGMRMPTATFLVMPMVVPAMAFMAILVAVMMPAMAFMAILVAVVMSAVAFVAFLMVVMMSAVAFMAILVVVVMAAAAVFALVVGMLVRVCLMVVRCLASGQDHRAAFHGLGDLCQLRDQGIRVLRRQPQLSGGKGNGCLLHAFVGIEFCLDLCRAVGAVQIFDDVNLLGHVAASCLYFNI